MRIIWNDWIENEAIKQWLTNFWMIKNRNLNSIVIIGNSETLNITNDRMLIVAIGIKVTII